MKQSIFHDAAMMAREVKDARENLSRHAETARRMVKRYHGPAWDGHDGQRMGAPENHAFEWSSYMLPATSFRAPRARVRTARPGSQREVAEAIRFGLNRWSCEGDFREVLQTVVLDAFFFVGALVITREDSPSSEPTHPELAKVKTPKFPRASHIPFHRIFWDQGPEHLRNVRFIGHDFCRSREEILAEAEDPESGWDRQALEELDTRKPGEDLEGGASDRLVQSQQELLDLCEVWVPRAKISDYQTKRKWKDDPGHHGVILTLSSKQAEGGANASKWLREPRPYYGHPNGPYVLFGCYRVPGFSIPLAPLVAHEPFVFDLNEHSQGMGASAAGYKRLGIVDGSDRRLLRKLQNAPHDFLVGHDGFDKDKFASLEIGGITEQMLGYYQVARDRLDRVSGMSDAARGNVEGRGTATEVAVAQQSSDARSDFLKQQIEAGVRHVFERVAWYLYHDDQVVFPLGEEAAQELGQVEPWFRGGDKELGSGSSFFDMEFQIEPYSLERVDPARMQGQVAQLTELLMTVGPAIPTMPYVNWRELFDLVGEAFNIPNAASLIDYEAAQAIAPAFAAQHAAGPPRLASTSGGGAARGMDRFRLVPGGARPGPSSTGGERKQAQAFGGQLAGAAAKTGAGVA